MFLPDTKGLGSGLENALTRNFLPCLAQTDINFLFQEVIAYVRIVFAPASLPHVSSGLWKFCRKRLESVHIGYKKGLWSSFCYFLCSQACGLWYGSESSLQVFIFCYFASGLVSKTSFRTSHQTPHTLERNWPLPFQCVNNFSHSFFHLMIWEGNFNFKTSINHLLEKYEHHAWIFVNDFSSFYMRWKGGNNVHCIFFDMYSMVWKPWTLEPDRPWYKIRLYPLITIHFWVNHLDFLSPSFLICLVYK